MNKKFLIILILLLVIQIVSAKEVAEQKSLLDDKKYLSFLDYFYDDEQIYKSKYRSDPPYSYSESPPESPVSDGQIGVFSGKKFCYSGDIEVRLSPKSNYNYMVQFPKVNYGDIKAKSVAYIQIMEKDNEKWIVTKVKKSGYTFKQEAKEKIFAHTHGKEDWNFDFYTPILIGEGVREESSKIPSYIKLQASGLNCNKKQYAAGVYVYTQVDNSIVNENQYSHIKVYSSVNLPSAKEKWDGLNIITPEKFACGVLSTNNPTISIPCGETGCIIPISASYAELNIPAGAINGNFSFIDYGKNSGEIITIYKSEDEQLGFVSPIYYITPTDLSLNVPATLTIEYNEDLINNENEIFIVRQEDGELIKIETKSINKERNRITAKINKLGNFVVVEDNTPPIIELNVNPTTLWPPNDKPTSVTINGFAVDEISGIEKNSLKLSVNNEKKEFTLDEYNNFNIVIPLTAKRSGKDKEGYKYNINLIATDNFGNVAEDSVVVLVPHDKRE